MNTIQTGSENLLDKLASSAQKYISKMQNEDDKAFADFLKDNLTQLMKIRTVCFQSRKLLL